MPRPYPVHPGELLLTEFMQPLGLTSDRLAKELAIPYPDVEDIVQGRRVISADTAQRLGAFFNLPTQFWLNLQNDFDLRTTRAAAAPGLTKIKTRLQDLIDQCDPTAPPPPADPEWLNMPPVGNEI